MFSLYEHKKKVYLLLSQKKINSRYVLPYYPQKGEENAISITRRARQVKIKYQNQAQWIALISDAGIHIRSLHGEKNSESVFSILNEQPQMILIGVTDEKILAFPLS